VTHDRYNSPWIATLVAGVSSMAMCLLGLQWLLVITGTGIALIYAAICIAAVAGRRSGATAHAAYKMPFYPFWPVVGLLALAYVFYTSALDPQVGQLSLLTNAVVIVIALGYYFVMVRRKGSWTLRDPEGDSHAH
jgi:amino acid transporter